MKFAITVVIEVDSYESALVVRDEIEESLSAIDTGGVILEVHLPNEEVPHE